MPPDPCFGTNIALLNFLYADFVKRGEADCGTFDSYSCNYPTHKRTMRLPACLLSDTYTVATLDDLAQTLVSPGCDRQ